MITRGKEPYNVSADKGTNSGSFTNALKEVVELSEEILLNDNHSAHIWAGGKRNIQNCVSSSCLMLDIDNGEWKEKYNRPITYEEIKEILTREGIEFWLYTSMSHDTLKPKGDKKHADGKVHRVHVLIPFHIVMDYNKTDKNTYIKVFDVFQSMFGGRIDNSARSIAFFFHPNLNSNRIIEHINGEPYNWETDKRLSTVKAVAPRFKTSNVNFISLEDEYHLKKGAVKGQNGTFVPKTTVTLQEINKKTEVFCNFCNDLGSGSASGWIEINGEGIPMQCCSSCRDERNIRNYELNSEDKRVLRNRSKGMEAFITFNSGPTIIYPDRTMTAVDKNLIPGIFHGHGLSAPTQLKHKFVVRDFETDDLHVKSNGASVETINLYKAPEALKVVADKDIKPNVFPTIWAWSKHLCPVNDEHVVFMQWLGKIVQKRIKLHTSWIIIGIQGSGKSLFFKEVVGQMLGKEHIAEVSNDLLKERFNDYLLDGVFHIYEEIATDKASRKNVKEKVKDHVTNDTPVIEGKHKRAQQRVKVTGNSVFLSNSDTPLELDDPDRRFNVIRTKNKEIIHCPWYVEDLGPIIASEIKAFVAYLKALPIIWNVDSVTINNEEKKALQQRVVSQDVEFWRSLHSCDLDGLKNIADPVVYESDRRYNTFMLKQSTLDGWKAQGFILESEVKTLLEGLFQNHKKYGIAVRKYPGELYYMGQNNGKKAIKYK